MVSKAFLVYEMATSKSPKEIGQPGSWKYSWPRHTMHRNYRHHYNRLPLRWGRREVRSFWKSVERSFCFTPSANARASPLVAFWHWMQCDGFFGVCLRFLYFAKSTSSVAPSASSSSPMFKVTLDKRQSISALETGSVALTSNLSKTILASSSLSCLYSTSAWSSSAAMRTRMKYSIRTWVQKVVSLFFALETLLWNDFVYCTPHG